MGHELTTGRGHEHPPIDQKLWHGCNVLRDDGMSHGADVEHLICRRFLNTADEHSQPPHSQPTIIPAAWAWPSLLAKAGDELFSAREHRTRRLHGPK